MKKIKFGLIGVGRLGYEHACNIANRVPGATLVAICDMNAVRAKEVADELGVKKYYSDPVTLCKDEEVDAVVIVTNTATHVDMIQLAMENGKHVFCEKPLADTMEKCYEAEKIISQYPDLTFMLGFMRRFDRSYVKAKEMIDAGKIGSVIQVRCYSQDPVATIQGTIEYGPKSGGQFIDLSIHDIDLIRWFTGSEPKKLWAIGGCYAFPEFAEWQDGDNVSALMQCENDAMGFLFAGRAAAHGSHVETEIIGTEGSLRIAGIPSDSQVEIMDEHGIRQECFQDFVPRWHDAYIHIIEKFCEHIMNKTKATPDVYDGIHSLKVAIACTKSFQSNELISL